MNFKSKRFAVGIIAAVLIILAGLAYGQGFLGSDEETNEQCKKAPYIVGKAYISYDGAIASLGDVLKMHVELSFCTDRIVVDRDTFNNMPVAPFDLRTRSRTRERKDGLYTIWEADYEIQPLNVHPDRKHKLLFAGVDYEDNGLLAHTRINSNEIYIGSFVSGILNSRWNGEIAPRDVSGITKHNIKEETKINKNSVLLIIVGGLLTISAFVFAFKKTFEHIRTKNMQESDIDYGVDFKSWFDDLDSLESMQSFYFSLRELGETHGDDERLKGAIDVANESFNPQGDVDKIKERLWPLVEPFAVELVSMGRSGNGVD